MKKIYLAAMAVAALTVSSCSQDEVLNINPEAGAKAIEFGVYTGKAAQTRGTETTDETIKADENAGFGVTAVYTGQEAWAAATKKQANFMFNQQVTYDATNGWNYNPLKYWPTQQNDKVSFFAYAPYSSDLTKGNIKFANDDTDASVITYTHVADLSENVDFVAASAIDESEANRNDNSGKISFTMKHELTRLALKAKVSEEVYIQDNEHKQTQLVIYDVRLENANEAGATLYSEASYTFNTDAAATTVVGKWTGTTAQTDAFDLNSVINYNKNLSVGDKSYVNTTDYPYGAFALTDNTTEGVTLLDTEHLYMIPALTTTEGVTGFETDKINLLVTYDIVTIDEKLNPKYSCTTARKIVPVTVKENKKFLEQGKSYTLTLNFKVDGVVLEGTVDKWAEETLAGDVDRDKTDKKISN